MKRFLTNLPVARQTVGTVRNIPMSILDKQLPNTPIHPSRRKPILIIGALLALLVIVFACTNVSAVTAFVVHFFTPLTHFTYTGHTSYVSAVA